MSQAQLTIMRTVAAETNISGIRGKVTVSSVPLGSTWEAEAGLLMETTLYRVIASIIYNGDDTYSIICDVLNISDNSIVYSLLLGADADTEEDLAIMFDGTDFWFAYFDADPTTAETVTSTKGKVNLNPSTVTDTGVFCFSDGTTSPMTGTIDDVQRFTATSTPIGFTVSSTLVTVNEGSTATFTASLDSIQGSDVTITPSTVFFGDDDITISGAQTISAGSTGPVTFTLTAAPDADWSHGTTTFELQVGDGSRLLVTAVEADTTHNHEWVVYDDFGTGSISPSLWNLPGDTSPFDASSGELEISTTPDNYNGINMVRTNNVWGVKADLTLNETTATTNFVSHQLSLETQTHGARISVSTEEEGTEIFCEIYSHSNYPTWTADSVILAEAGIGANLGQTYSASILFDGVDFWIEIDGIPLIDSRFAGGNAPGTGTYWQTNAGIWLETDGLYTGVVDNVQVYQAKAVAAPVITDFTDDNGPSDTDNLTSDTTPTFTGTGLAYSSIEVFDGAVSLGTTTCDAAGDWSFTTPSALTAGLHSITAVATLHVSSSPSTALDITIDDTVPVPNLTGPTGADLSTPFTVSITTDTDGTGPDGLVVGDITVVNGAASGLTSTGPDAYDVTITPDTGTTPPYTLTVDIVAGAYGDQAGNPNLASNTYSVLVTSGPTVSITGATPTNITPIAVLATFSEPVSGLTEGEIVVTNGTVDVGSLSPDSVTSTSTYTFNVTPAGEGTVTVTIPDAAAQATTGGNDSVVSSTDFEYDITKPSVALATTELSPSNSATFDVTITFSESTSDFVVGDVTVTNGAAALTGSGTTYTATITPAGQGDVIVDVAADVATDAAGNLNTAAPATVTVTYDSLAPAAPTVDSISDDTGDSGTDEITSDNTLMITGTAEINSLVTVYIDAAMIGTVAANGAGDWIFNHTGTTLADNTYAITATATDAAGNTGLPSSPLAVTVDTTAPTMVDVGYIEDDNGWSATDEITNDQNIWIYGTSETGVTTVEVFVDAASEGFATIVNSGGDWEFDYTGTTLGTGTYAVTATASDAAGNTSPASTATNVVIDITAPTVALTTPDDPDNVFTVTATFSEDVQGFDLSDITVTNGTVTSAISGTGSVYTFDVTPAADGAVTITVDADSAMDEAGNLNTVSNTLNVTGDVTSPTCTLTGPATATAAFTVTATFNEAVTGFDLTDVVVLNGTASGLVDTNPVFTFTVTPDFMGDVSTTVNVAAAVDGVGNPSTVSNTLATDVPPSCTLTGPATAVGAFVVTATFSEAVTGFVLADITVANGTASGLVDTNPVFTFTVTPDFGGDVTTSIAADVAVDGGANGNTASNTLATDIPPTCTLTGAANATGAFTVTATFNEAVTGFDLTDVVVVNGSASALAGASPVWTFTVTPNFLGDVSTTVIAGAVVDGGANPSFVSNILATDTPPSVVLTTTKLTVTKEFTVTATFSESVTGLTVGEINVTNGTASALSGTGNSYTFTVDPTTIGPVNVTIPANRAQDAGANGNRVSNTLIVVSKRVSSSGGSSGCNVGASSNYTLLYLIPLLIGAVLYRRKRFC